MSLLTFAMNSSGLSRSSLPKDPLVLFNLWLGDAKAKLPPYQLASAMCLSTVGHDDSHAEALSHSSTSTSTSTSTSIRVSSRMVMLRQHDARGFGFFTNRASRKASDIRAFPQASLTFHWAVAEYTRTVRVEGAVEEMPEDEIQQAWERVPRANQIQVYTTADQSAVLAPGGDTERDGDAGRALLDARQREVEARFAAGGDISEGGVDVKAANATQLPLPLFWGGYRVVPHSIEFWQQGTPGAAHDRFIYTLTPPVSAVGGAATSTSTSGSASHSSDCDDCVAREWTIDRLVP
jgi:pyridoxamine 5'-phosphate oxidase